MEWAKTATYLAGSDWVAALASAGACLAIFACAGDCGAGLMGMVHRSAAGSLRPCSIILSLYIISQ